MNHYLLEILEIEKMAAFLKKNSILHKKRAFFARQNCIFLKIKKIRSNQKDLHPMQEHIPNTRKKFEVDRLISFRVTTAAILKNVVVRKTRLKF